MPRLRSFAFALMLLLSGSVLLTGCSVFGWCHREEEKAPEEKKSAESEYDRLAAKAEQGDAKAARKLAEWCYLHDADNTRAKYWLGVAAQHGDEAAGKVAERVADWQ